MDADEKVLKIGIECMERYDGALKQLAAIEREELKEELEVLKKKTFQSVAIACMAEYTRMYGEMPEDESWMFLEAEYYGTGEGKTICLQMTQANPYGDDYDGKLSYPDNYEPLTTQAYRAVRGFHKLFGTWHLHGLRFHTREEFFKIYDNFLPAVLVNLKDEECFLEYHSELHFNFA